MTNLRYTSFALDWITAQKRAKQEAVKQVKQRSDTSRSKTTDGINDANNKKHDGPIADIIPVINEPETSSEKKADERGPSKGESRFEENASVTEKSEEESSVLGSSVDYNKKSHECGQDDSGSANTNAVIDTSESTAIDSPCNQKDRNEMEVEVLVNRHAFLLLLSAVLFYRAYHNVWRVLQTGKLHYYIYLYRSVWTVGDPEGDDGGKRAVLYFICVPSKRTTSVGTSLPLSESNYKHFLRIYQLTDSDDPSLYNFQWECLRCTNDEMLPKREALWSPRINGNKVEPLDCSTIRFLRVYSGIAVNFA